ncbi:hypothetical protein [Streptomyces sp. NPDC004629]|uniref:hypothetical protein n=1 Tax=Streptomyces sp. NPDC004629 TaxID=3364705 RepID=UPI00369FE4E5
MGRSPGPLAMRAATVERSPAGTALRSASWWLGMALEGVRREAWLYGGVRYDKQVRAILAPEWRALA